MVAVQQEARISTLYYMVVKEGEKNAAGLSRRFSLIILQVSLNSNLYISFIWNIPVWISYSFDLSGQAQKFWAESGHSESL